MARIKEEQAAAILKRVKTLLGETDLEDEVISQVIDDAAEFVCAYTHRAVVPDDLIMTVGDLAIVRINRMGAEGDAGRSEAGERYSFEAAPAHVFVLLKKYRVARCGGYNAVNDKETDENQAGE